MQKLSSERSVGKQRVSPKQAVTSIPVVVTMTSPPSLAHPLVQTKDGGGKRMGGG